MQWNSLDKLVEEGAFSGVVRVRRHGQPVYERAAGFADRANSIANTAETRFGIASGTKLLTALTVGRLIDAGRLALTTQVRDCISVELPDYSEAITIQHLLTHTSSVRLSPMSAAIPVSTTDTECGFADAQTELANTISWERIPVSPASLPSTVSGSWTTRSFRTLPRARGRLQGLLTTFLEKRMVPS